jgi:4-hydroxy-3-methylbut-2-enyl diphosphate reductase
VNDKLRTMGIGFLSDPAIARGAQPDDVVILPAFGVTVQLLQQLDQRGCTLVDTTCGSVLNVWKNVKRYAEQGYTSVIHGKVWHERRRPPHRRPLPRRRLPRGVRRRPNQRGVRLHPQRRRQRRVHAAVRQGGLAGFDPRATLERIGLANQTTMLMSESLAIGEMLSAR